MASGLGFALVLVAHGSRAASRPQELLLDATLACLGCDVGHELWRRPLPRFANQTTTPCFYARPSGGSSLDLVHDLHCSREKNVSCNFVKQLNYDSQTSLHGVFHPLEGRCLHDQNGKVPIEMYCGYRCLHQSPSRQKVELVCNVDLLGEHDTGARVDRCTMEPTCAADGSSSLAVTCTGERSELRHKVDDALAKQAAADSRAFWIIAGVLCCAGICWCVMNWYFGGSDDDEDEFAWSEPQFERGGNPFHKTRRRGAPGPLRLGLPADQTEAEMVAVGELQFVQGGY